MIQLVGIKKSFPDGTKSNVVLKNVNFSVSKGEFVAIKGASGSGKTTLLSILGTLIEPNEGRYIFDNQIIYGGKDELLHCGHNDLISYSKTSVQFENTVRRKTASYIEIRNKKIGFVFQDHRLLPQLTVLQNILLPTIATQNKANKEQMDYAEYLMSLTGISQLAHHYPQTVSGGEASRAALCRALVMKPLLLLADEPTGQLDNENANKIVSLLKIVNSELGTTILLVSHSQETVAAAGRILLLNDGVLL